MRVLVTGGAGFIGSRVTANLLNRGIPVVVADLSPGAQARERILNEYPGADADFTVLDISDARLVDDFFRHHKGITHVIHLASLGSAEVDRNPRLGAMVNVVGTLNLFEAAARDGLARLVYLSSHSVYGAYQRVYGSPDHAVREDEYCGPQHHLSACGLMKLLNEYIAAQFGKQRPLTVACVRAPQVFGYSDGAGGEDWAVRMISLPAVGKPATVPVSGGLRRCWLYKDDCAEQLVRLALKPTLHHTAYNTGGCSATVSQVADAVREWIPGAQIRFTPDAEEEPAIGNTDGGRLAQEISLRPRSLSDGVRAHINEARKRAGLDRV